MRLGKKRGVSGNAVLSGGGRGFKNPGWGQEPSSQESGWRGRVRLGLLLSSSGILVAGRRGVGRPSPHSPFRSFPLGKFLGWGMERPSLLQERGLCGQIPPKASLFLTPGDVRLGHGDALCRCPASSAGEKAPGRRRRPGTHLPATGWEDCLLFLNF